MTSTLKGLLLTLLLSQTPSLLAQDHPARQELKRTELSGAPGMEVVMSVSELKPGMELALHLHHGVEAGYVLEGGRIQAPGKEAVELTTGTPLMNLRDIPHAGFKVVGPTSLKLLTVHVVDKGKPLYDWVQKKEAPP